MSNFIFLDLLNVIFIKRCFPLHYLISYYCCLLPLAFHISPWFMLTFVLCKKELQSTIKTFAEEVWNKQKKITLDSSNCQFYYDLCFVAFKNKMALFE